MRTEGKLKLDQYVKITISFIKIYRSIGPVYVNVYMRIHINVRAALEFREL
jgi:hypothetical protein